MNLAVILYLKREKDGTQKITVDLFTFTEEILNGKLHFLYIELFLIWCI